MVTVRATSSMATLAMVSVATLAAVTSKAQLDCLALHPGIKSYRTKNHGHLRVVG